jgi:hypothetical protein
MLHPLQSRDCLRERDTPIIVGSGALPSVLGKYWIVNKSNRETDPRLEAF